MQNVMVAALCIPLICLVLVGFLPNPWLSRRTAFVRQTITNLALLNAAAAFSMLVTALASGPLQWVVGSDWPVSLSFYIDGVAALMLSLVASVGWIICRYSIRYLDAEANQARYFRWTAFTIGSVSLVVVTGNLIVLVIALLLTSCGLHQLLVHYEDRPAARRAAAIKFLFSRLGDVCLLIATFALYREFGTFELSELFARIGAMADADKASSIGLPVAAWSIVMCAVFKSAQFPFHTWLPETMESPTSVSALMHAGIVNAGGYLLIRTAPIVTQTPVALLAVACLGVFTAAFAALVMMSQTSIKRKLAWSTIAQMGFMIFQCGIGAFSAAMLHIIAHSLYKAHAFLSCGSVMKERVAMATAAPPVRNPFTNVAVFVLTAAASVGIFAGIAAAFGVSVQTKPGSLVLGLVLCLGMAFWMRRMFVAGTAFVLPAVGLCVGMMLVYFAGFTAVDFVVAPSLIAAPLALSSAGVFAIVTTLFVVLLLLEAFANSDLRARWMTRLYVHSSNGFYVDVLWRNATKAFSS